MTDRRLRVLVAVAVLAGAAVAGVLFATQGSGKSARVLQIDEVTGRVGRIVLGETEQNVIGTLGQPLIPYELTMAYPHLIIALAGNRVVSIRTTDPAARTEKVVRIGDPISAARASYGKAANCVPNSPDKTAKDSYCNVAVPSGTLHIDGDPITSMTLARTG